VPVVEGFAASRRAPSWGVTYRIGPDDDWCACRLLDISLDGGVVELDGDLPDGPPTALPFLLQIDSIADDDVGIQVPATIRHVDRSAPDAVIAEVEFSARREERMLLHLLVRLHQLV
jgi:hypothetical protein